MHTQQEINLAILFADVSGSTQLYEQLGDFKAQETVAQCIDLMTAATARHRGTLVKTIGDEVMSTFRSADAALAAAIEMQEAISGRLIVEGRQLKIRVGCHFGGVIIEDRDVFGDAVNLASRVANQAKAGQILTTGETVARLSNNRRGECRQIDRVAVRGKSRPVDLYEVVWQSEELTVLHGRPWATAARPSGMCLVLSWDVYSFTLDEDQPALTVGRATQNDIVVNDEMVSRLHARLDYRNGRFILTDQSANGTFIVTCAGDETYVHRDNYVLSGSGLLGLGQPPEKGSIVTLQYRALTSSASQREE